MCKTTSRVSNNFESLTSRGVTLWFSLSCDARQWLYCLTGGSLVILRQRRDLHWKFRATQLSGLA